VVQRLTRHRYPEFGGSIAGGGNWPGSWFQRRRLIGQSQLMPDGARPELRPMINSAVGGQEKLLAGPVVKAVTAGPAPSGPFRPLAGLVLCRKH
jgi:hypothetical protein